MERERSFIRFLRRNAAYIVLALCVAAIGISLTVVFIQRSNAAKHEIHTEIPVDTPVDNPTDDPVDNPIDDPEPQVPVVSAIVFDVPVENAISIGDYTETLAYNATLKRYEAHKAIDIFAAEGSAVYAAWDGTVESVETTLLTGTTVVIDHGNGLKTVYNSLLDGDEVVAGQAVKKGDRIGEISVSNRQESAEGAHLHFAVTENGVAIDPAKYLVSDEK